MALMPKRVKYRKTQKASMRGVATRGSDIEFGEFGIKALGNGKLKEGRYSLNWEGYMNLWPRKRFACAPINCLFR